ncbi:lipopolysaccharide biosynthesis protein [Parapedobacter sp. SGR-10]|uniref:lipopolysaccharide biosynthesis protein n=1 Tax=Parapedobacter sp. SGR-10 TaxID=2710879 RepID=UPI0013D4F140|nr:lipopolysaccharide biosynthesis protein [Parapedobacter sp. SGR-10]NGF57221.1 lipopolysaccharide biosynthesis protein [Parapedobacter sp. SGR-10]
MSDNAKHLTLKGLFWNAIDRFGNQAIVTIVGIVTARVLSVEDFAVVAVLTIFSTVATSFIDSGLGTSLVRTKVVEEKDYSSMFVFNLAISSLLYLILFFAAPFIEDFYHIKGLTLYARVLFLQLLIHAFGIVQYIKTLKNMQFNITARVNILSIFLSGAIAIVMTFLSFGAWVLVLLPVLNSVFRTTFFWIWGDWRLDMRVSKSSLKKHMGFSLSFMVANLFGKTISPLYNSIIGKYYNTLQTGYYYQANKWGETPNLLISSVVQGTTLSTLTLLQDDPPRFLNACRKTMSTLSFVLFPVSLFAISAAEPGFVWVLTDKYLHAVGYFQLLCFAGLFISLTELNVNFINIKGQSKYALQLEIVKIGLACLLLFLTYDKGILYIIWGQMTVRIICFIISTLFSRRVYGYHLGLQLRDALPSFLMGAAAAFICYMPQYFSILNNPFAMLILQGIIFLLIYSGLSHLTRNTIWTDVLELVKRRF